MAALNHLHLRVRDVSVARAFYAQHFGLRDHVWHGDVLFMRDDAGMDLALAPSATHDAFPPWFHFGFRLSDAASVEALYLAMTAAGVDIRSALEREEADGFTFFRCADPDGHQIEVYWEADPA